MLKRFTLSSFISGSVSTNVAHYGKGGLLSHLSQQSIMGMYIKAIVYEVKFEIMAERIHGGSLWSMLRRVCKCGSRSRCS